VGCDDVLKFDLFCSETAVSAECLMSPMSYTGDVETGHDFTRCQPITIRTKLRLLLQQQHTNVPALVLGLSSCEHSVMSLLSTSVFISKHSNSVELPAHTQRGNRDGQ